MKNKKIRFHKKADFAFVMADSEPNFGARGGWRIKWNWGFAPRLQFCSQNCVRSSNGPWSTKQKRAQRLFSVWRTMADSNRRHQASEACALSIWANGAYSAHLARVLVYHILPSNARAFCRKLYFCFQSKNGRPRKTSVLFYSILNPAFAST